MDYQQIKTFLKAAELMNFTKAAEELQYSQPAVTSQIRQLEKELHCKLFERIGNNIQLTEKGKEFADYAHKIMFYMEQANISIKEPDDISGHVRIGCLESIAEAILPQVIQRFRDHFPSASIGIVTDRLPVLMNMLNRNEIDILFLFADPIPCDRWILCYHQEQPVWFVASADHELAGRGAVSLEQLSEAALIVSSGRSKYSYTYKLKEIFQAHNIHYRPRITVESVPIILTMVLNNTGISFLPQYVVQKYLDSGQLVKLEIPGVTEKKVLQVFCHRDKKRTPTVDQLLFEIGQLFSGSDANGKSSG